MERVFIRVRFGPRQSSVRRLRERHAGIACTRSLSSAKCTFIAASRIIGVRFVLANETETRLVEVV